MVDAGLYIIKDTFFTEMNDSCLKGNKAENRPHYYCFTDSKTGLFWMIPLSSKIEKYKGIIRKREDCGLRCDIAYIARLDDGKESAFLIGDMFPVTADYILRPYTLGASHFIVTSERDIEEINSRCKKVLALIRRGVKLCSTQPNVLRIEQILLHTSMQQNRIE